VASEFTKGSHKKDTLLCSRKKGNYLVGITVTVSKKDSPFMERGHVWKNRQRLGKNGDQKRRTLKGCLAGPKPGQKKWGSKEPSDRTFLRQRGLNHAGKGV